MEHRQLGQDPHTGKGSDMSLWDDLLVVARRRPALRPPRQDLWAAAQKVLELELVVQELSAEVERLKSYTEHEIGKLRMRVDVLKAHETRGRNG